MSVLADLRRALAAVRDAGIVSSQAIHVKSCKRILKPLYFIFILISRAISDTGTSVFIVNTIICLIIDQINCLQIVL